MVRKKVLIAEDDKDILFILDMVLKDAGYAVEPLTEGSSIVARTEDWPDLFIIDQNMPFIDGIALCKFLRLKEETKNIPIIMISCFHKLKGKARKVGVDDFIEKPFHLKELLRTVGKYTALHDRSINSYHAN
jgi:DNA-binding response OmpR family regulator